MIPLAEAQAYILQHCPPAAAVAMSIDEALGRVCAETVASAEQIPPFDNTAVDGYAVRAADLAGASENAPTELAVVHTMAAGVAPSVPVGPGEAIRIMTGAPMPAGADSVAMVEWTQSSADGLTVTVERPTAPGDHVRRAGDDLQPGDQVFGPGTVLGAGHLGVLASLGRDQGHGHPVTQGRGLFHG